MKNLFKSIFKLFIAVTSIIGVFTILHKVLIDVIDWLAKMDAEALIDGEYDDFDDFDDDEDYDDWFEQ